MESTFRIRLEDILVYSNVPSGMDPCVALGMVKQLRSTNQDWEPIDVIREGDYWRLKDGRHRYVAALIAGRSDILAQLK